MKRALLLLFLLALFPALGLAQDYVMYETQYLRVLPGHANQFNEAIKAHNDRFHASGPYRADVWYVGNGPRSGQMFWTMGPCTFTDLDNRPSGEEHDGDWTNNVLAHAEGGETEYWRLDQELSYRPDTNTHPKLRVRFFDIKSFEAYRFEQLERNIKQVLETKKGPMPWTARRNASWSGTGRDRAMVDYFDTWAELDREDTFPADYEEVHGEGAWRLFLEEVEEIVLHAEEEFHELIPELSAPPAVPSDQ